MFERARGLKQKKETAFLEGSHETSQPPSPSTEAVI